MSYLALARKWRPRKFEDVAGQDHVVKALSHALNSDRLHPAILLTGTRGVGKTTLARIIAKGLNCEKGVSAHPCGVCSSCKEIDEGRSVDMLEIDAASNTGVDNIRELIENSQYAPAKGRYKVYLIDEVHMLSKGAFNALLKTLEEPPPHIKFILATTDPQKLPVTVLSRCLQFNLKRLPAALIRQQLEKVLGNEHVEAETAAVAELARAADGSMRDGLSLLDQAIAFAGGAGLKQAAVEEMLGTGGRRILYEIIGALGQRDASRLLACIEKLDAQAPDYGALLNDLAAQLQRIAVLQMVPAAQGPEDDAELVALKGQLSVDDVQLYYQTAVIGRRDLPYTPDPRLGFEMTLLRMLAFKLEEGEGSARPAPAAKQPVAAPAAKPAAAVAPAQAARPAVVTGDMDWNDRIEALALEGFVRQLARNCAWVGREGDTVKLALDSKVKHLSQEDRRLTIERALSAQLNSPIKLVIELSAEAATPSRLDHQRANDHQRAAEAAIETDPAVRAFKDTFGASVRPGSVQPVTKQ